MKKYLVFALIASSAVLSMAFERDGYADLRYNRTDRQMGQLANAVYGWNSSEIHRVGYRTIALPQPVYSPVTYQVSTVVYYQAPAPVVHQTSPYGPVLHHQPAIVVQQPVYVQPTYHQVCRQYPAYTGYGQVVGTQTVCQ